MSEQIDREHVLAFASALVVKAEQTLKVRLEMESVMRGGSEKSWRAVGYFKGKAHRLKEAEIHARIAVKNRRELEMFKAVLQHLTVLRTAGTSED